MQVSKKLAAQMVNIGRTTFYRHIKEKPISVGSNGKIDVSELIRVYGSNNVRTPEQLEQAKNNKNVPSGTHRNTPSIDETTQLKEEITKLEKERLREREQLTEEIENLRSSLKDSMSQNKNLTSLLTDQRELSKKDKDQEKQTETLFTVLQTVKELQEQQNIKKGIWKRLFRECSRNCVI